MYECNVANISFVTLQTPSRNSTWVLVLVMEEKHGVNILFRILIVCRKIFKSTQIKHLWISSKCSEFWWVIQASAAQPRCVHWSLSGVFHRICSEEEKRRASPNTSNCWIFNATAKCIYYMSCWIITHSARVTSTPRVLRRLGRKSKRVMKEILR